MTTELLAAPDVSGFQRRSFLVSDLEVRSPDNGDSWEIGGIACTVDVPYQVPRRGGEFTETMEKGSFTRTLSNPNARVSLFAEHNWRFGATALATRKAGTLELVADPHLRFVASLDPKRPDVQILRSAIARGESNEMSVGYDDVRGGVHWNDDFSARTVSEAALREISITEEGCNGMTSVSLRSLLADLERSRDLDLDENELRRAIRHFESLLPPAEGPPPEVDAATDMAERSGLVVTDEMISLFERRFAG